MTPLSTAPSSGITWSKIPRGHELKLNGEIVGKLLRPSCWSSRYEAETQDGRWIFQRSGFFGTGSEILDANSQQQVATFKSVWGTGGTVTFSDGQTLLLRRKGWWRPVITVITEDGRALLHLHSRDKFVELHGTGLATDARLSLLSMFTLYRLLQDEEDAASVAAVSVIAAS